MLKNREKSCRRGNFAFFEILKDLLIWLSHEIATFFSEWVLREPELRCCALSWRVNSVSAAWEETVLTILIFSNRSFSIGAKILIFKSSSFGSAILIFSNLSFGLTILTFSSGSFSPNILQK